MELYALMYDGHMSFFLANLANDDIMLIEQSIVLDKQIIRPTHGDQFFFDLLSNKQGIIALPVHIKHVFRL